MKFLFIIHKYSSLTTKITYEEFDIIENVL